MVKIDHENKKAKLLLKADEILTILQEKEKSGREVSEVKGLKN